MKFRGEFRFLSNFWPVTIKHDGLYYPTVENAYQASKTLDQEHKQYISTLQPGEAKKFSRGMDIRGDWNDIKIDVMYKLLQQKFTFGTRISYQLMQLKGDIVEDNHWNDTFWGVCNGKGENHLGKLLMKVREELWTTSNSF